MDEIADLKVSYKIPGKIIMASGEDQWDLILGGENLIAVRLSTGKLIVSFKLREI